MINLALKPTDKLIKRYFAQVSEQRQLGRMQEGAVAPAFADLLGSCAQKVGYRFSEQYPLRHKGRTLRLDGAVLTPFNLRHGVWEAKDSQDDLRAEIRKKFDAGYPDDNILFQSPDQAILIQNGREVLAARLDAERPQALVDILQAFFGYVRPAYDEWERAVAEFKDRVPEVAQALDALIEREYGRSAAYKQAFDRFLEMCRRALNPNLSKDAVEEMLIQHILTERIFRRVFSNPDFTRRNAIAREIETVVDALIGRYYDRDDFMRELDRFYGAIETTAADIRDYNEKQDFLNTVYEQFFQGFSVKTADTHGIVYTPQPIVQFMVRSVEELLRREFGRSLADEGVHILDPFVGTGNFILRVMEEIRQAKPSALPHKYHHELHANEIMLLPYYIASMNIEHAYYEAMGEYAPFPGICLVDTFELYEGAQRTLPGFGDENVERVKAQQASPIFVVIGNPPYNVGQVNENDNNKNRKYPRLDARVRETYVKASRATLRNKLFDPYVKAFRWASDRIGAEGVVAFVSNNSFVDNVAFDGMRQCLLHEFDAVYVLDLGGNVRKNPKLSGTTHNVFGIQVGVCITLLVRKQGGMPRQGALYYARVGEDWRRTQKYDFLDEAVSLDGVTWQPLAPKGSVWLTEGLRDDWAALLPLGTKEAKAGRDAQTIFGLYSLGVVTSRDVWVYNYRDDVVEENVTRLIRNYNYEVFRYTHEKNPPAHIDSYVNNDPLFISWTDRLKQSLVKHQTLEFIPEQIRHALYRPFSKQFLYFDHLLNQRCYQQPRIFPTPETERENVVIVMSDIGYRASQFSCLVTNVMPDIHLCASIDAHQCFPLYVYEQVGGGYPHPPAPSPVPGLLSDSFKGVREAGPKTEIIMGQVAQQGGDLPHTPVPQAQA